MPGNPNHSTKACVHSNADTFSCGNASQDVEARCGSLKCPRAPYVEVDIVKL